MAGWGGQMEGMGAATTGRETAVEGAGGEASTVIAYEC